MGIFDELLEPFWVKERRENRAEEAKTIAKIVKAGSCIVRIGKQHYRLTATKVEWVDSERPR